MDLTADSLYSKLCLLGDFYPLRIRIDRSQFYEELAGLTEGWKPYNKDKAGYGREGLSLFSLNGETSGEIDLNSVREYNHKHGTDYNEMSFRTPTPYWHHMSSLSEPLAEFVPYMGRSHLLRFDEGGFFPPHRDLGDSFRLIAFMGCMNEFVHFTIEQNRVFFDDALMYFANTQKSHSLVSYQAHAIILVLNLEISQPCINLVKKNLLAN